jgi:hypothetical protein
VGSAATMRVFRQAESAGSDGAKKAREQPGQNSGSIS